jgi:hypothetical protein
MSKEQNAHMPHIGRTTNRPVHTLRYGAIRAAIWKNLVDNGNTPRETFNVTFSRGYNDGKQWRDSNSFSGDDLLVLAKIADEAHTWISRQRSNKSTDC